MSRSDNNGCAAVMGGIGCLGYPIVLIVVNLWNNAEDIYNNFKNGEPTTLWVSFGIILLIVAVLFLWYIWKLKENNKSIVHSCEMKIASKNVECEKFQKECERQLGRKKMECENEKVLYQKECEKRITNIQKDCDEQIKRAEEANKKLEHLLNTKNPFRASADMYAEIKAYIFDECEEYLRTKPHPAYDSAQEIKRKLRVEFKNSEIKRKEMEYKYNFLLSVIPQLKEYVMEEESLISMADMQMEDLLNQDYDHTREYLSDEEWNKLTKTERYQLALDKYKERRRANAWVAGVEYEMYCSYLLRKNGFYVIEHGVNMRKSDLGRDIIAKKNGNTYIIQCKRYSIRNRDGSDRFVHENVICQLFGTTIEYKISNPNNTLFANMEKIVPVLYTTGKLSDTANAFASQLGVKVLSCQMGEYPMIKCNRNNGEMIFHLPFDQQYWNTIIDETRGECYAWTVQEAEEKGFRRAYRWRGQQN